MQEPNLGLSVSYYRGSWSRIWASGTIWGAPGAKLGAIGTIWGIPWEVFNAFGTICWVYEGILGLLVPYEGFVEPYLGFLVQYEGLKPHREGWRWQFVYNLGSNWYQTNMNINIKVKYIYNHWTFFKWVGGGVNLCLLIQMDRSDGFHLLLPPLLPTYIT